VTIQPTNYQARVLAIPPHWNVFCGGGRGGGKSYAALLLILRHLEEYQDKAHVLVVRETHRAVAELADKLGDMLHAAYGKTVRFNKAELVYRLSSGATVELGQLDSATAYRKYQGRSFTLIFEDEVGSLGSPKWIDLLKSNLRAADGIPLREIRCSNPGGNLHSWLHSKYITKALAWHPFEVDGEIWVYCPSTYLDNHHLNHEDYLRRLRAAAGQDEAILKAWVEGDWNIARGAYFADVIDQATHMLPSAFPWVIDKQWKSFVSVDWGSSAPAVAYFCLRATGDHHFHDKALPRNSLILLDEISTAHPNDPTIGMGWPPGKLAEAIVERCEHWGINKHGCADDAAGLGMGDNLISVFEQYGLYFERPQKGRIQGWSVMRELLANAKERNGRPGLFVSERCKHWWRSVPFLPRDEHRVEDVDTNCDDHPADSCRYAAMYVADRTGGFGQKRRSPGFFHPAYGLVGGSQPEQVYRNESGPIIFGRR
jgi:hypothetical protein